MKKTALLLGTLFLGLWHAYAEDCGEHAFPEPLPTSVCVDDSVLLAKAQDFQGLQAWGDGIVLQQNGDYYFKAKEHMLQTGYAELTIGGNDTCNTWSQKDITIKVTDDCNQTPCKDGIDLPSYMCDTVQPIFLANKANFTDLAIYGTGITYNNNETSYYFDPSLVEPETQTILTYKSSEFCSDAHVNDTVYVAQCSDPCDKKLVYPGMEYSEVCSDVEQKRLFGKNDIPVHALVSSTPELIVNHGPDGFFLSVNDYTGSLPVIVDIKIQTNDQCDVQYAYGQVKIKECNQPDCDTLYFENEIPDVVCTSDDSILIAKASNFKHREKFSGLYALISQVVQKEDTLYYFMPSAFDVSQGDLDTSVTISSYDECDNELTTYFTVTDDCPVQCVDEIVVPGTLPDTLCMNDDIFVLPTPAPGISHEYFGEGTFYQQTTQGGFAFDPSEVSSEGYVEISYGRQHNCLPNWKFVYDSIYVKDCSIKCDTTIAFANPIPDTMCTSDNRIFLTGPNYYNDYELVGDGLNFIGQDAYFHPEKITPGQLANLTLEAKNECGNWVSIQEEIFVKDCSEPCNTSIVFPHPLPDTVCNTDDNYLLADQSNPNDLEFTGFGVLRTQNAYYFDPSEAPVNHTYIIRLEGTNECGRRATVDKNVFIKDCSEPCAPLEFTNPLPKEMCINDAPIKVLAYKTISNANVYAVGGQGNEIVQEEDGYYFDPALAYGNNGDTSMIVLQAQDAECGFRYISWTIKTVECDEPCNTTVAFANPLPDTMCVSDDSILIAGPNYYDEFLVNGKEYNNEDAYFNPNNFETGKETRVILEVLNNCEQWIGIEKDIYIKDCSEPCQISGYELLNLPDTVCNDAEPFRIASYTVGFDLKNKFDVGGDGVIESSNDAGTSTVYYWDFSPSRVTSDKAAIWIENIGECNGEEISEKTYYTINIKQCTKPCPVLDMAPLDLPDTVCQDADPIWITSYTENGSFGTNVSGEGVVYGTDLINERTTHYWEFNPEVLITNKSEILIETIIVCQDQVDTISQYHTFNVTVCTQPCEDLAFPHEIPDTVCSADEPILIANTNDFEEFDAWGDGVTYTDNFSAYFFPNKVDKEKAVIELMVPNGCPNWSKVNKEVVVVDCLINGSKDFTSSTVEVYPNPANNEAHIAADGFVSATLVDMTGNEIMFVTTKTISLNGLSSGVYLLKIELENGTFVNERIVKQQ